MNDLGFNDIATAPTWSLALGVLGRVFVIASASLFALSAIAWLQSKKSRAMEVFGKVGFAAACWSVVGAFVVLGVLFATKRYEFNYVYQHADNQTALAYRIAGIWSGQQGSFLLWAVCSAIFALFTVRRTAQYRRWYSIAFAFFLGGITSILAFESPFVLNLFNGQAFVPPDGAGLAPSLNNYWVTIHPPTIFLGFGSLTCLFALAFAALATKDYDGWIPIVRPWAIVSVALVGLGLCMGGFWAYETLGWGGFWMWDPVENVSFVPWIFAAAFVHGVIVQATKKRWKMTNLVLAALPFLIFLYGTFLTRSGILGDASVHSFAEMDRYALKLLIVLMGGTVLGFGGLWGFRAWEARKNRLPEEEGSLIRRESFYVLGVISLLVLGTATAFGMSVPLIMVLQGKKPSIVEEGMYHEVLSWIFIPLMLLMAVTPFVTWRGMKGSELGSKAYSVFCITVGLTGLFLIAAVMTPFAANIDMRPTVTMFGAYKIDGVQGLTWIVVLFAICVFVIVGNGWRVVELFKRSKLGVAPFLAHVGVAILMAGLIVSRGFEQTARSVVMKDHPGRLLNYEVRYAGMTSTDTDRNNKIRLEFFDPSGGNKPMFTATPGLYYIKHDDGSEDTMVWPSIQRGAFMDTYVSLGTPQKNAGQETTVQIGKTAQIGGVTVTYKDLVREGTMGQAGSSIGAKVEVSDGTNKTELTPRIAFEPSGQVSSQGAPLGDNLELALVAMNPEDKSATLRVQMTTPVYPIEVFHKPMTILVWLGTFLMAMSGFASAFYRRSPMPIEAEAVQIDDKRKRRSPDLKTDPIGTTS